MEIRYAANPTDTKQYTTDKLREEFLIESLFEEGQIHLVYSHHDRVVVGGAIPTGETLKLDAGDALRTDYFLERREIGIVNIGPNGTVTVDGEKYPLNKRDCLYVGLGNKEVTFESDDPTNRLVSI